MVTDLKSVGCHSPRVRIPLLSARFYTGRLPCKEAAFDLMIRYSYAVIQVFADMDHS